MFNTSATDMQLFRELKSKNRRAFSRCFTFRFVKSTAAHCGWLCECRELSEKELEKDQAAQRHPRPSEYY
jgi:hypothetical protein